MVQAKYVQAGETLDYVNAGEETIPEGTIVTLEGRVGVTGCPIPPGGAGSLHMGGVFEIANTSTAAVGMGQALYFDGEGMTTADGNGKTGAEKTVYPAAGYAAAPAEAGAETILVKLCG